MSGVCTSFIAVLIAFTIREIKVESEDDDSCDYSKQETSEFPAPNDADTHTDDNNINRDENNDEVVVCPNGHDHDENNSMVSKKVILTTTSNGNSFLSLFLLVLLLLLGTVHCFFSSCVVLPEVVGEFASVGSISTVEDN